MVFVGTRSRSRIFQLSPPRNDKRYHVIVTVQVDHLTTRVTVRSPLQVSYQTYGGLGRQYMCTDMLMEYLSTCERFHHDFMV